MPIGVLLAALLGFAPAGASPLMKLNPEADSRDAQEQIDEIQRRIDLGDLPKIQFDLDSAKLRSSAYEVIDLIAQVLRENPRLKLRITAHTCTIGERDYNMRLSRSRAKSVKEALVKSGIPPPFIRFYGKGPDDPIADNRTEEGRELNRRVEFHIIKRGWSSIY